MDALPRSSSTRMPSRPFAASTRRSASATSRPLVPRRPPLRPPAPSTGTPGAACVTIATTPRTTSALWATRTRPITLTLHQARRHDPVPGPRDVAGRAGRRSAGAAPGHTLPSRMSIRSGDQPPLPQSTGHREAGPGGGFGRSDTRVSATFTGADLAAVVTRAERLLARNRVLLDRLDAELGDGDHGENMTAGFADAVRSVVPADPSDDVGDLLRQLGHQLVSGVGGAGGSLYGTAFIEAGIAVAGLVRAHARGHGPRSRCGRGGAGPAWPLPPGRQDDLRRAATGRGRLRRGDRVGRGPGRGDHGCHPGGS